MDKVFPISPAHLWALLEDRLYPALRCSPIERTLYNHLLRHTLLAGRRVVRRTKSQLSQATGICATAVRDNLRALEAKACLRIRQRAQSGLLIEVFVPRVNAGSVSHHKLVRFAALGRRRPAKNPFKSPRFRQAIRRRDGGRCFYCQRPLPAGNWGLDHIVSRAHGGTHTAGNAAACCGDCNREKGEQPAADFLASLHARGRLTAPQLAQRLQALRRCNTGL